jgi:predicted alpha-1,6-mannanase (GH76 family)
MNKYVKNALWMLSLVAATSTMAACDDTPERPDPTPKPPVVEPGDKGEDPMSNPTADLAFEAYNDAFLVSNGSLQYYREALGSDKYDYFWCQALDVLGAEDAYMRTQDPSHKALIKNLLLSFLENENGNGGLTDWNWNDFNDDLLWAAQIFVRGYRITGEKMFLDQAEYAFNRLYDRGWDDTYGGGIWWAVWTLENPKFNDAGTQYFDVSKSGLSNNPAVVTACYLYELTGNIDYLAKAVAIYDWVRETLYVESGPNAGGVDENISPTSIENPTQGRLTGSYNVYNVGAFVEGANYLHRITGESRYYEDAKKSIDFIIANRTTNGVMTHTTKTDGTWQSEFARGMGDFVRDNNAWDEYYNWMRQNATAAWNSRNTSLDVGGCDWTNASSPHYTRAVVCVGTMIMQQVTPASNPAIKEETTYRITPKLSRESALDASGNAAIQQWADSDSQKFTVVDAGNGYYRICPVADPSKCLALAGANISPVSIDPASDYQLWKLRFNYKGYFTIMPKTKALTNLALTEAAPADGDECRAIKIADADTERWIFEKL